MLVNFNTLKTNKISKRNGIELNNYEYGANYFWELFSTTFLVPSSGFSLQLFCSLFGSFNLLVDASFSVWFPPAMVVISTSASILAVAVEGVSAEGVGT